MDKYICLNCFREWEARTNDASQRRCSDCHSRVVIKVERFEKAVDSVAEVVEKFNSRNQRVEFEDLRKLLKNVLGITVRARIGRANVREMRLEILRRAREKALK